MDQWSSRYSRVGDVNDVDRYSRSRYCPAIKPADIRGDRLISSKTPPAGSNGRLPSVRFTDSAPRGKQRWADYSVKIINTTDLSLSTADYEYLASICLDRVSRRCSPFAQPSANTPFSVLRSPPSWYFQRVVCGGIFERWLVARARKCLRRVGNSLARSA